MKIAIIGAGFSGLALAWHLLQNKALSVTVYDKEGVGKGASGVASGLLHPYAGEQARRSWRASEAIESAKVLLDAAQRHTQKKVADYGGLLRHAQENEQIERLLGHAEKYKDVKRVGENHFFISSGITVFTEAYLEGLFECCRCKGLEFIKKKWDCLEQSSYDTIIVAAGAGIKEFEEFASWQLSYVKGQGLTCDYAGKLSYNITGKGHIIQEKPGSIYVGATYERNQDVCLDTAAAVADLEPKANVLLPGLGSLRVSGVKAGLRVLSRGHYLPQVGHVKGSTWVMTGLGSRGLLYHSYFAAMLVGALLRGEPIPAEVDLLLSKNKSIAYNAKK